MRATNVIPLLGEMSRSDKRGADVLRSPLHQSLHRLRRRL